MILGIAAVLLHQEGKRKTAWSLLGVWAVLNVSVELAKEQNAAREKNRKKQEMSERLRRPSAKQWI